MIPNPIFPPRDGSVTLPEAVDFHIEHNPDYPVWIFNEDGTDEITTVTYLEYGRACHRVAHKMRPGRRGPEGEMIAVVALSDNILYNAVSVGLTRAGMVVRAQFSSCQFSSSSWFIASFHLAFLNVPTKHCSCDHQDAQRNRLPQTPHDPTDAEESCIRHQIRVGSTQSWI